MAFEKLAGWFSLASSTNKIDDKEFETKDGIIGEFAPELKLDIDDKDLIKMKKGWIDKWVNATKTLQKIQERNEKYWLGQHFTDIEMSEAEPLVDNRLFSSLETFLPIATKQNPEPLVEGDDSEDGRELANKVKKMLVYLADVQVLKLKIKSATRNWALYHLGMLKVGWDNATNDIMVDALRPQRMILDPTATVEEGVNYTGKYIGERKKDTAADLVERFPKKEQFIKNLVRGKMGTDVQYIEWWTPDFLFWTLKDEILDKFKNPHWNYDDEDLVQKVDEFGNEVEEIVPGVNHFLNRRMPYIPISIFNIGKHPWDDTSLMQQNISLQDMLNRRMRQIDRNIDNMNNGIVLSGDHFTREQAANAAGTLARGGALWVPHGDVNTAYKRDSGASLPADVFNNTVDTRNEIDNIFGTHGTTRGERGPTETATGRIVLKESDVSRIGGGITEYLEQAVDQVFNWWTQLMYVYYDEEHIATVVGTEQAREQIKLIKDDFVNVKKLTVSVKEGSLLPTDELTKRNEAIELWGAGAISIIDLYKALKVPDPKEAAKRWFQQQTDPASLFGEEQAQQPTVPPTEEAGGFPTGPEAEFPPAGLNNFQV